jgi:2,3-bisphosphoglycerate-dependent phosphoglycerate mutase
MKSIYFVRHGKASLDGDDLNRGLTEEGSIQAEQLMGIIKNLNPQPSVIYSSPYRRAILSIEPYANSCNIPITTNVDLREKKISDKPIDDIVKVRKAMWKDLNYRHTGGETGVEVQERGMQVIKAILAEMKVNSAALIASHGNFIGLMINIFKPEFRYDEWKNMSMPDIFRIDIEDNGTGTISHIDMSEVDSFKIK